MRTYPDDTVPLTIDVPDSTPGPEEQLEAKQMLKQMLKQLGEGLDARELRILHMLAEEFTIEEIAAAEQVTKARARELVVEVRIKAGRNR